MKQTYLFSSVLFALGASFVGVGCQDSFTDCKNTATCPPEGDGDGDSSTGGVVGDGDGDGDGTGGGDGDTGGTGTGGGDGDGDGDGDSTGGMGGDPNNPCLLCENDEQCTPEGECVECLISDHCLNDEAPVCDADTGVCVECDAAEDCEDPALPMCESNVCVAGCGGPEDCTRFGELGACDLDAGECVQCVTEADCGGNVCDPDAKMCTILDAGVLGACDACQYDAECAPGRVCVEMSYSNPQEGIVGNFCLWRRDATGIGAPGGSCGLNSQPFAQEDTVTSVNGTEPVVVCQLRTTTCPALKDHAVDVPECLVAGDDDAACGAEGFNDGRCRGSGSTLCTYPCLGTDDRDCPGGASCVDVAGDKYCGI